MTTETQLAYVLHDNVDDPLSQPLGVFFGLPTVGDAVRPMLTPEKVSQILGSRSSMRLRVHLDVNLPAWVLQEFIEREAE